MDLVVFELLPDEILHKIFTFVAASPSLVGPSICIVMRPLSKSLAKAIDEKDVLWKLAEYQDLRCGDYYNKKASSNDDCGHGQVDSDIQLATTSSAVSKIRRIGEDPTTASSSRRRSSRLRPTTAKERYIHRYNLLLSRNESALLELQELAHSSRKKLSVARLKSLLMEYHPIAVNRRIRTGGTYLVEVVRSRYVTESVILKCVRLLVEKHGADVNIPSAEAVSGAGSTKPMSTSHEKRSAASGEIGECLSKTDGNALYPLVIAAARGMPTVVKYLLSAGADVSLRGSSRFRLMANPRKTVNGVELTPLEFATRMRDGELKQNATRESLRGLRKAISLLRQHEERLTGRGCA